MKNTKMLVLILLIICVVVGVYAFWDTVTDFFVAALCAYLLSPLVGFLVKKIKCRRGLAVALVLIFFLGVIVLFLSTTLPSLFEQLSSLVNELKRYSFNFDNIIDAIGSWLEKLHLPPQLISMLEDMFKESDKYLLSLAGSLMSYIVGLSMRLFDLAVLIILMIYFMLDGPKLISGLVNALPAKGSAHVNKLLHEADEMTWRYIRSRCIVSGGMAIATYIGLKLMGIRYAMLFAIISFVLDFIPYFGSFIAGAIEVFYALITSGLPLALGVLVFVLVVQQIEGNIVAPRVQGNATGLHPITVMFSLLVCSQVWGGVGMLISTPVAAVVKMIIKEMYAYVISPDEEDSSSATDSSSSKADSSISGTQEQGEINA